MPKFLSINQYKNNKSKNEELNLFRIQGRITRRAFILRCLFAVMTQAIAMVIHSRLLSDKNENINSVNTIINDEKLLKSLDDGGLVMLYLPLFLGVFVLIQAVKRIHDVNKSGWFALLPFYNIYLILEEGSASNNDFGINPRPQVQVTFFDELK